jgi:hypothetical protein
MYKEVKIILGGIYKDKNGNHYLLSKSVVGIKYYFTCMKTFETSVYKCDRIKLQKLMVSWGYKYIKNQTKERSHE